ncbi:MAG: methylated-DNA--[protein]-cysteine S-methyltransferase [Planctomycetota bacterium]|nr:methylated-DNA--[protein]-cysteine S-methyltransferase [Planctomycetota bacterium]MDA1215171.1 methylated-DNA--[protein]-cysteine S-methyltransferase [Planctomycetota bacterium]
MSITSKARKTSLRRDVEKSTQRPFSGRFYSLFETDIGWIGFRGEASRLSRVTIGHRNRDAARRQLCESDTDDAQPTAADWFPELREQFERFLEGEPITFRGYELVHEKMTSFQRQVFQATSALTYGATASYSDIATRIGRPNAARAVGNALGTNRFPLLIPCHRVLASGGQIGGFTAPQGIRLKAKLLEIEHRGLNR